MDTPEIEYFPEIKSMDPNDEQTIVELIRFLENRIQIRDLLREDLLQKQNDFRNILVKLERKNISLMQENSSLKMCNEKQRKTISSLEGHIDTLEERIVSLAYKLNNANDVVKHMRQELKDKDRQLKQHEVDMQKITQKCNNRIQAETDRMSKELEIKLCEQRHQLEVYSLDHTSQLFLLKNGCIKKKDDKLKLARQILLSNRENISALTAAIASSNKRTDATDGIESTLTCVKKSSETRIPFVVDSQTPTTSTVTSDVIAQTKSLDAKTINDLDDPGDVEPSRLQSKKSKIPVVNPRYRRSRGANKWIDHRPAGTVPLGTILQPQTPRGRSVMKLTNVKAFTAKSAKYCLFAQEQDTDGELETKLYKADVLPTSGGGAQIVFNDIEYLKQISPVRARRRWVNLEEGSAHSANASHTTPKTVR